MIRIISHNACWFQGYPYEELNPAAPNPNVLRRLVEIYRLLNPDVVCIQEVQDKRMADQLASKLGTEAIYTRGGAYPQYGCATFADQIASIADGNACASQPHRAWQICGVSVDGLSLNVGNVHLTSNRFHDKQAAALARIEDLRGLLESGTHIDLICGDFNEGPREDAALMLEENGFVDAAIATGAEIESTGVNKRRSDQIWVRGAFEQRIAGFGTVDWDSMAFEAPGKNVLSDHLPLWLELKSA